ncbi:transglycosylase domain-containing protein [Actinomyces sp. MRS3W]|uniref:transglycosylase domain-containing protein n=1 Tax=Actinomyces sp. MRS3W TaxID=2800796 RepID=UPI0028FD5E61|nr:transglycosylase domain-containing protein [Actinomyces sp. MRS3W]MDU0347272.1 transglycosylase domain-containing protein [Actinomyces sp. MRS3W]
MSKSSSRGRSISSPAQVVAMLLVFLLLSGAGGVLAAGFAMPAVGVASAVTNASAQLFDELPDDFNVLEPSQVSVIKASDGTQIAQFYAENRIVVSLDNISTNMQNAIVAVEDQRFYQHKGVDPAGIVRAIVSNASGGSQGASTLTQQYVRNILIEAGLQNDDDAAVAAAKAPTVARKLREIKYALTVEQKYSKQQILEGYLNIASFGPSTYGVEASAQHYFSHSAKDLSIPEAALLAGLTNAPGLYDPIQYPDKAKSRMDWVLKKMYEEEFITEEEYQAGLDTQIADMLHVTDSVGGCGAAGSAAYFCEYVVGEIENSDIYGATEAERRQLLLRGGLEITTTLDTAKQDAANNTVQAYVPTGDPSNVKAALVSIEPGTGRIVAMAQNTNYGEASGSDPTATQISYSADYLHGGMESNGFQPGSAFKTFALAQWYQEGRSGYTVTNTTPRTFYNSDWTISCDPDIYTEAWTPKNADPASENGKHTVVDNTALSINVGYAEMLAQMDVCNVTQLAAKMGVTKANGDAVDPYPSIVLGGTEATPLAMANAYATFAAHGVYCTPVAIDSITDADGNEMSTPSANCTQVMDATAADKVTITLQSVLTSKGTGTEATLNGRPAAGKTGTTDEMDNAWFIGYTPQLATAIWAGHSDGYYAMNQQYIGGRYYSTMYGADMPAPMFKMYMDAALAGEPVEGFNQVSLGSGAPSSSSDSGGAQTDQTSTEKQQDQQDDDSDDDED